jgi:hypothetical protein
MAENDKSTQSFALGLIVAAIIYLIFRSEWRKMSMRSAKSGASSGVAASRPSATSSACGCGSDRGQKQNQVVSIGAESYSGPASFPASSVVSGKGSGKTIWTS